ncbi:aldo/keto reductase [Streptomyces sp. NPDC057555]|uniref:aldo/keto reductase n=1 Tax=Streptomyces sp. NPDC057555 TaxID=3346166 RepID=UPI0036CB86CB
MAAAARRAAASPNRTWVDTAPNYAAGRAQQLLARALADHPGLLISTKVGFPAPGAAARRRFGPANRSRRLKCSSGDIGMTATSLGTVLLRFGRSWLRACCSSAPPGAAPE